MSQKLDENTILALRERCKNDLFFLCRAILGYKDMTLEIHGPVCEKLSSKKRRKLVIMPRDWFKSSIGTIGKAIQKALQDPNNRILIVQNSFTNACKKLKAIREIFDKNTLIRALFPELLPDSSCTWRDERLDLRRSGTFPEGTFEAAGTGTATTSRHYDLIIEDDTVAPDVDSMSGAMQQPTNLQIEKAIGWHRLATALLSNPQTGEIIVIGTRWAPNDLIGWIIEHELQFYDVITRAVREKDGKPCSRDNGGVAIWARFNEEVLAELEIKLGPYMFATLMMNNPTESSDQTFVRGWITYFEKEPDNCIYCTSVDPEPYDEEMKSEDPDYGVVITTCVNLEKTCDSFVCDYVRRRMNPGQMIDEIFAHVNRFHPIEVIIEAVAYQRTLKYWIERRQRQLECYFGVTQLTHGRTSKGDRIRALQPFFAAGHVHIKGYMSELEDELLQFPSPRSKDDIIDALSMQVPFWRDCAFKVDKSRKEEARENTFSGQAIISELHERTKVLTRYPHDMGIMKDRLIQRYTPRTGQMPRWAKVG